MTTSDTENCIKNCSKDRSTVSAVPATRKDGSKVRGVYYRGDALYVRIPNPETGRLTFRRCPARSIDDAERVVKQAYRARSDAEAKAWKNAFDSTRRRRRFPTIRQCIEVWPELAEEQRRLTGSPCEDSIKKVPVRALRVFADGLDESVETAPDVLRRWIAGDGAAKLKQVTVVSDVRTARQIFSAWARRAMRARGFELPPLEWPVVSTPRGEAYQYQLPPQELREKTIEEGKKEVEKRSQIGEAFLLQFFCAMSAADALRARWDWLRPDGHVHYIRHKTGKPANPPLTQWALAQWQAWAKESGRERVMSSAKDFLIRPFARWMRSLGWTTGKCGHELRKLACSRWFSVVPNPAYVESWIGDTSVVTRKFYAAALPELETPPPEV